MLYIDFITQLIFAIAASALVGVEREFSKFNVRDKFLPIFGVRSFIFIGVIGFLFTKAMLMFDEYIFLILGFIIILTISTATYLSKSISKEEKGSTTYISSFIVFFIGVFSGIGDYQSFLIAATLSIITTLFLALGNEMTTWTQKIRKEEILAAAKIGILSVIILPLVPNEYMGPYNLINPFKVWYVVVAISLVYFVSYILMKEYSKKGLFISSFFSGIIYSSPTVYQLSDLTKGKKEMNPLIKSCIFIACFSALLSHLLIILFIFQNVGLVRILLLPYTTCLLTLLFFSYIYAKDSKKFSTQIDLYSPFSIKPVLKFGFLFMILVLLGGVLNIHYGELGLLPTTTAGSLVSATTVIASLADLVDVGNVPVYVAANWIILAAIISTLIKVAWVSHSKNKDIIKTTFVGTSLASVIMFLTYLVQTQFLFI